MPSRTYTWEGRCFEQNSKGDLPSRLNFYMMIEGDLDDTNQVLEDIKKEITYFVVIEEGSIEHVPADPEWEINSGIHLTVIVNEVNGLEFRKVLGKHGFKLL